MFENFANIAFAAFFFPAAAAVLIFAMKYVSGFLQARARAGQDEAYRELAARSTAAQAEMAASLSSLGATLGEMHTRLVAVEKILREVE